jgi:hypothetical protein
MGMTREAQGKFLYHKNEYGSCQFELIPFFTGVEIHPAFHCRFLAV